MSCPCASSSFSPHSKNWNPSLILEATLAQPVPKKGDRSNPSKYRPIAQVFEYILNSHFLYHLEKNLLLSDHQYGFRKARSTGDLLSYLTHLWSSSLRDFGESFVVALDISKAFDRVWHKALLAKLPAYGFTSPLCNPVSYTHLTLPTKA